MKEDPNYNYKVAEEWNNPESLSNQAIERSTNPVATARRQVEAADAD